MEWYGARMLPRGMPELAYQVTPERLHPRLKIVVRSRSDMQWHSGFLTRDSKWRIDLYPTVILRHLFRSPIGVFQFTAWYELLYTYLHEVGHILTELGKGTTDDYWANLERYRADRHYYRFVEQQADDWADTTIERIADRDERLGQPSGWIGGLPGIYLLRYSRWSASDPLRPGYETPVTMDDYRAYRCGGQLNLTQVLRLGGAPCGAPSRVRRAVIKGADRLGIARHWTDKAGRRHRFFTYGEARAVLARTSPSLWHTNGWPRGLKGDVSDFDEIAPDGDAPADAPSQSATDETLADFSNEALSEDDDLPF